MSSRRRKQEAVVLSSETTILAALWLLGHVGSIVMNDFVHVLLGSAIIVFGFRPVRRQTPKTP